MANCFTNMDTIKRRPGKPEKIDRNIKWFNDKYYVDEKTKKLRQKLSWKQMVIKYGASQPNMATVCRRLKARGGYSLE
jgi:hypothetical protein